MESVNSQASPRRGTAISLAECEWCGHIISRKGTVAWKHDLTGKRECE